MVVQTQTEINLELMDVHLAAGARQCSRCRALGIEGDDSRCDAENRSIVVIASDVIAAQDYRAFCFERIVYDC